MVELTDFVNINKETEAGQSAPVAAHPADVPEFIRQKISIISAHFLLQPGARIADMGCGRGQGTFVLAMLNPRARVIGIDRDPAAIAFAKEHFNLPNLSFQVGDVMEPGVFEDASLDAILNSNILNRVYSEKQYNPTKVSRTLENQVKKLKAGGKIVICDYIAPPPQQFVLLELPDEPSAGPDPDQLSDVDLLISFSHTARPLAMRGCEGFFLEELPAQNEGMRLFRLPYKWAVEFVLRKDYRADWEEELKYEYSFFTHEDFQHEFTALGLRTVYLSPYWNPWVTANRFEGKFRLYTEEGQPMSHPPTSYFIVAQVVGEKASIILQERRPSREPVNFLEIETVRDDATGKLFDIIRRPGSYCDVVPYRITKEGRLVIYARHDYPRPIVNSVSRGSPNLDGKHWSGHLIEPIQMDTALFNNESQQENLEELRGFLKKSARLSISRDDSLFLGPMYYPAPDFLEVAIEPLFVEVEEPLSDIWTVQANESGLSTAGTIRELDARDLLRASQIGLLPEARLEVHIFTLMRRLGIEMPPWVGEKTEIHEGSPKNKIDDAEELEDFMVEGKFSEVESEKGATHKVVRSVFVDDGLVDGAQSGLGSTELEFVIPRDEDSNNVAVILPMTRDLGGEVLLGLEPKYLPVPNRLGGDSSILGMPSFPLPRHIKTIDQAKEYLGGILGVPKDRIGRLGESYYTFIGMTPQRIYPFVVATDGSAYGPNWVFAPIRTLWKLWDDFTVTGDVMKMFGRSYQLLGDNSDMMPDRSPVALKKRDNALPSERTRVSKPQTRQQTTTKAREHLSRVTSKGTGMATAKTKQGYRGYDGSDTANLDLTDVRISAPPPLGSDFKKITFKTVVPPQVNPAALAPPPVMPQQSAPPPLTATRPQPLVSAATTVMPPKLQLPQQTVVPQPPPLTAKPQQLTPVPPTKPPQGKGT